MKIVLVGYMGSGKTTVGEILAKKLNATFIDLDKNIEENTGKSIPEIFSEKGEIFFRKKENECLIDVLNTQNNFILSTGGGTPCYGNNMNQILEATKNVFYLKVSIPELVQRLSSEKDSRPLVKSIADEELPDFIGKHLFERSFYYMQAHHAIESKNRNVSEMVDQIKTLLV